MNKGNNNIWIFRDGVSITHCPSFPIAYRKMHETLRVGVEKGRKYEDMVRGFRIIAPPSVKDSYGEQRTYDYHAATSMATAQGLLNPMGEINSREFKRKKK